MALFDGLTARDYNHAIDFVNKEVELKDSDLKLDEEHAKWYNERLKKLKEERKANPGIPISYWPAEVEWD